jgi:hypothetical protein
MVSLGLKGEEGAYFDYQKASMGSLAHNTRYTKLRNAS